MKQSTKNTKIVQDGNSFSSIELISSTRISNFNNTNLNAVRRISPRYEPIKHDISMCNIDVDPWHKDIIEDIDNHKKIIPKHVLIVDDVVSIRKILSRLFRSHNISCDEAENGQEAINKILNRDYDDEVGNNVTLQSRYDLILMDYEMPIMNGPTCVSELRKRGYEVVIIGITGNVLPDDINFFKLQGADEVLLKPINYNSLIDTYDKISQSKILSDKT